MRKLKYPRTFHLAFSEGVASDDKIIKSLSNFIGREVVVTEKLDGENTTFSKDYFHARSVDSRYNFTRAWVKLLHSIISKDIPNGFRLCGENLSFYHSIEYTNLEGFFYLFSVWDDNNFCLSWDAVQEWANLLNLPTPRIFYRGIFDEDKLREIAKKIDTRTVEGFTVRLADKFHYDNFNNCLVKWVRKGHVQPQAKHWLQCTFPNKLKPKNVRPEYMPAIINL